MKPFDPSLVVLAMVASVEAIFLSTFILISQNRMQRTADRRAELDLQIGLLTEHELTRAIQSIDDVAQRLGAYHAAVDLRVERRDVTRRAFAGAVEYQLAPRAICSWRRVGRASGRIRRPIS